MEDFDHSDTERSDWQEQDEQSSLTSREEELEKNGVHGLPARFELLKVIGEGGMGKVYHARDTLLSREVAIKVLSKRVLLEREVHVLHQEAKTTGKLNHPSIARALDFDLTESGEPFLVMEFVKGETLSAMLRRVGPLDSETARLIFTQILEAIQHAHESQVIHRDLKPSNIMLTEDEGETRAVVLDFGIAKDLGKQDGQFKTKTGMVVGSPLYISPEQIEGGAIDPRTDIYAMGCVMFECLTGSPPFRGATAIETISMHLSEPPPRLSERIDKSWTDELEQTIERTLEKNPDLRFQTADELLEAIAVMDFVERSEERDDGDMDPRRAERSQDLKTLAIVVSSAVLFLVVGVWLTTIFLQKLVGYQVPDEKGMPQEQITADLDFAKAHIDEGETGALDKFRSMSDEELAECKQLSFRTTSVQESDLKRIEKCKSLILLDLAKSHVSNDCLPHIAKLKTLKSLLLNETEVSGKEVGILKNCEHLESLDIRNPHLDKAAIEEISKLPNIRFLTLASQELNPEDLCRLAVMPNLEKLDIRGIRTTDETLECLSPLPKLYEIAFLGMEVTDNGIAVLSKYRDLKTVSMRHSTVSESTTKTLARIPKLQYLDIGQGKLKAGCFAPLETTKLRNLYLKDSDLTNDDLKSIAKLTSLKHLSIEGNSKITDIGLAEIAKLPRLEELRCIDTAVTPLGIKAAFSGRKSLSIEVPLNEAFLQINLKKLQETTGLKELTTAS